MMNINKKNVTVLIIIAIMILLVVGGAFWYKNYRKSMPTNENKTSTPNTTTPVVEVNPSEVFIDDYPDKITTKINEFPFYEDVTEKESKINAAYDTYATIKLSDFIAKIKKVDLTSKGAIIVMMFKNTSAAPITITKEDIFVMDSKEKSNFFPSTTINTGETKEVSFTIPKSLQLFFFGENKYLLMVKNMNYIICDTDANEKITDANPIDKHMELGPVKEELKNCTTVENYIIGNKEAKMLRSKVEIVDKYKDKTTSKPLFIGFTKITMANTSDKDITISENDINLLSNRKEMLISKFEGLPKFKTITVKPGQIINFKVPVIVGPDVFARIDISINGRKFVFPRLSV